MILEKIVFVMSLICLICMLGYKFLKNYDLQNIFMIGIVSVALGSYLPFVIYKVSIPKIIQVLIFCMGIIIPSIYTLLQYNNIKITRKLLYYNLKKLYKNKEYSRVIDLIKKAVVSEGYNLEYLMMLGNCYSKLNDNINAQEFYEMAIKLDKYNYEAYLNLAKTKEKLNKNKEAVELYINAIKIKSNYYEAYECLAINLTGQGIYRCAMDVYNKAINIFPDSYELLYNVAMLESEIGEYEMAVKNFEKVIELKPDLYSAYYSLGKLYFNKKEYEKSIEAYKHILTMSAYSVSAYYNIAIIYCRLKDYDRAMTSLEYVMESDSHYIKEANNECSFEPIRDRINDYQIQKEKLKLKQYSNRNFIDKSFKLIKLEKDVNMKMSKDIKLIDNTKKEDMNIEKEKLKNNA